MCSPARTTRTTARCCARSRRFPDSDSAISAVGSFPMNRDARILALLGGAKLAVHLAAFRGYSIFRDELYYLACADHLAWGYVDHPPLSIAVLWLVRAV